MPLPWRPRFSFAGAILVVAAALPVAAASRASRSWTANDFQPLTRARIADLPPAEQPPWLAYWTASEERLARMSKRPSADVSPDTLLSTPPKGGAHSKGLRQDAGPAWYASEEAAVIADRVVASQSAAGAWQKGNDYTMPPARPSGESGAWISGTFDNHATISELRFLARVVSAASGDARAVRRREAFQRGLGYIFAAQYPNGGFPQIYPLAGGYHDGVTFNDDAMTEALALLRDVARGGGEFAFVPPPLRREAHARFARGLRCVLAAQLRDAGGRPTAWCQQYDPLTLQPAAARNFEPIADAAQESAALALLLMTVPDPSPEIVVAVEGAVAWFHRTALHDVKWESRSELVAAPGAPLLWARFYEPGTTTPIFGDRDRSIHYDVAKISSERRAGYAWFGTWPAAALAGYEAWRNTVRR